jgi:TolA-binding protein
MTRARNQYVHVHVHARGAPVAMSISCAPAQAEGQEQCRAVTVLDCGVGALFGRGVSDPKGLMDFMCDAFLEGLSVQKYKLVSEMEQQLRSLAQEVKELRAENEMLRQA